MDSGVSLKASGPRGFKSGDELGYERLSSTSCPRMSPACDFAMLI